MTDFLRGMARNITDPTQASVLPPNDHDQRTLDAVDAVLVALIQKSKFRERAHTLNLARAAINRELGSKPSDSPRGSEQP